jgi:kynurenine formamidase
MPVSDVPSLADVRDWLVTLRTWGRWGTHDDLGTLNFLGPDERATAIGLATGAKTLSMALPITFANEPHTSAGPPPEGAPHAAWSRPQRFVIDAAHAGGEGPARHVNYDAFLIAPHGPHVTHLDAPRHTVVDGTIYNGLSPHAPIGTIASLADGIVGRGVLLDLPRATNRPWLDDGEAIGPAELELAESAAGVRVGCGDILLVRTGYRKRLPGGPASRHAPRPGLHASCLPWIADREVSVLGADVAVDVIPHGYESLGLPIHTVGMWAMGLWLIDNCALEAVADECAERERSAFLLVIAPLVLEEATGCPINPLAVF